jgi:hypothetical protein
MKKIEREVLATTPVAAGCCIKDGDNGNTDTIIINH